MPSAELLKQKEQFVKELSEKLKNSAAGVLVDYKGITVADDTKLRKEFREAGVEYTVIKNTMLRFAAKEAGLEGIIPSLEGTTALALCESDPIAPAKVAAKYADSLKNCFTIKAALWTATFLTPQRLPRSASFRRRISWLHSF